jgi:hypothetical protein
MKNVWPRKLLKLFRSHLNRTQEADGSIPFSSTILLMFFAAVMKRAGVQGVIEGGPLISTGLSAAGSRSGRVVDPQPGARARE